MFAVGLNFKSMQQTLGSGTADVGCQPNHLVCSLRDATQLPLRLLLPLMLLLGPWAASLLGATAWPHALRWASQGYQEQVLYVLCKCP